MPPFMKNMGCFKKHSRELCEGVGFRFGDLFVASGHGDNIEGWIRVFVGRMQLEIFCHKYDSAF